MTVQQRLQKVWDELGDVSNGVWVVTDLFFRTLLVVFVAGLMTTEKAQVVVVVAGFYWVLYPVLTGVRSHIRRSFLHKALEEARR